MAKNNGEHPLHLEEYLQSLLFKVSSQESGGAQAIILQQLLEQLQTQALPQELSHLFLQAFLIAAEHQGRIEQDKILNDRLVIDFVTSSIRAAETGVVLLELPQEMLMLISLLVIHDGRGDGNWLRQAFSPAELQKIIDKYESLRTFTYQMQKQINTNLQQDVFAFNRKHNGGITLHGSEKFVLPIAVRKNFDEVIFLQESITVHPLQGLLIQVLLDQNEQGITHNNLIIQAAKLSKQHEFIFSEYENIETQLEGVIKSLEPGSPTEDNYAWNLLRKCMEVKRGRHAASGTNIDYVYRLKNSSNILLQKSHAEGVQQLVEKEAHTDFATFNISEGNIVFKDTKYEGFISYELIILRAVLLTFRDVTVPKHWFNHPWHMPGLETPLRQLMLSTGAKTLYEVIVHIKNKLDRLGIPFIRITELPTGIHIETDAPMTLPIRLPDTLDNKPILFIEEKKIRVSEIADWMLRMLLESAQTDPQDWVSTDQMQERAATEIVIKSIGAFRRAHHGLVNALRNESVLMSHGIPADNFIEMTTLTSAQKREVSHFRINPLFKVVVE